MNVYIETNFVLELTLFQEEYESCERISELCERGQIQLIIPAYSLAEPNETLIRRDRNRKQLARELEDEFKQLRRSTSNSTSINIFGSVLSSLILSGDQQRQRLADVRERLLRIAEIISLDHTILSSAAAYEKQFDLSPQDALVFASVLQHLSTNSGTACFLTRNPEDFNKVNMRRLMEQRNCKMLFNFGDGYGYIQSQR